MAPLRFPMHFMKFEEEKPSAKAVVRLFVLNVDIFVGLLPDA